MFYCIDFDTRTVESKCESKEDLEQYVVDNDLDLAVAIIGSEEDLLNQFSIEEMLDLSCSLGNELSNDPNMPSKLWNLLEEKQEEHRTFTPEIVEELLEEAELPLEKRKSIKTERKNRRGHKPYKIGRSPIPEETPIHFVGDIKFNKGSILHSMYIAIEEELCTTVGEVVAYLTKYHIIPKTGKPADEKFAQHNIKYFVRKGCIKIEVKKKK